MQRSSKRVLILGSGDNFLQIVEEMSQRCNKEEMIQFVGIACRIWLRRNEVIHRGVFSPLVEVVKCSLTVIVEFQVVKVLNRSEGVTDNQTQWRAPSVGWLMVN